MVKAVYDPTNINSSAFDYNNFINTPDLKTVATTGDYDDLTNKPTLATVATLVLLLTHVIAFSVALDGNTVAVSVSDLPISSERVVLLRVTSVTATSAALTVTEHVAVFPFVVFAVKSGLQSKHGKIVGNTLFGDAGESFFIFCGKIRII